jgi:antirestriction protein ArdC
MTSVFYFKKGERMMSKVYEYVTERIIKKLEEGTIPWKKPWTGGSHVAVNWVNQKAYRGINQFLLEPGEYATLKQIVAAGGRVKKEEFKRGHFVVFWKWLEIQEEDSDEKTEKVKMVPFLRYYTVYEINTQCTGLQSKRIRSCFAHDPIAEAEILMKSYLESPNAPELRFAPGRAYYQPTWDYVSVPPLSHYKNPAEYYCTIFHELVHSTGHKSRLNRPGIQQVSFGSETYSKEELIAELGAAMLCAIAGIDNSTIDNSAAYIQGWLKALNDDKKMIVQAAAQAQKAVDLIQGEQYELIEFENESSSDEAVAG